MSSENDVNFVAAAPIKPKKICIVNTEDKLRYFEKSNNKFIRSLLYMKPTQSLL